MIATKYKFVGKETDFEDHLLDNLDDIADYCDWGEVQRYERGYVLPMSQGRIIADLMLWHPDGSGTVIECKTGRTNRNDMLTGIGQLLFYGQIVRMRLGQMPRLVLAMPRTSTTLYSVIQEFKLPIHLLSVDGDECIYVSPHLS